MPELRIGCSGFHYQDWKGSFYPSDLAPKKWFEYYYQVFNTVELNVTFYRLPYSRTFENWYNKTPPEFAFSIKGSRFVTHIKRLLDPALPLESFFNSALQLKEKLKVVLWQFPPGFTVNRERLSNFLGLLYQYPNRNALEFRHKSWITDDVVALCKNFNVGLCMADWPKYIDELPVTADFVYIRRHGKEGSYATSYSIDELRNDARRISNYLNAGKDVFIYFNNDYYGYAPKNARQLEELLK